MSMAQRSTEAPRQMGEAQITQSLFLGGRGECGVCDTLQTPNSISGYCPEGGHSVLCLLCISAPAAELGTVGHNRATVFVSTVEGMGVHSCCLVHVPGVSTSSWQAGPVAGRTRDWEPGNGSRLWVWVMCWRDQHHKVATAGTRRSKPAPSESPGSGADWHKFVGLFLSVGGNGAERVQGPAAGAVMCVHVCIFHYWTFLLTVQRGEQDEAIGLPCACTSVSGWGNVCGCLFIITLHEKRCWCLPVTLKVNFPSAPLSTVGERDHSWGKCMDNKSRIPLDLSLSLWMIYANSSNLLLDYKYTVCSMNIKIIHDAAFSSSLPAQRNEDIDGHE